METKEYVEVDGISRPVFNSKGKLIHHTEEGIINFWRWFGNSTIVDDSGKPLVVYHGTKMDFAIFDIGKGMSGEISGNPIAKYGFFFTDKPDTANSYAGDKTGSNVMPMYILLRNPYEMDMWRDFSKLSDKKGIVQDELMKHFIQKVKRKGHDGIILKGRDTYRELMVFKPTQIKSATGNKGGFNPNSSNIMSESAELLRLKQLIERLK